MRLPKLLVTVIFLCLFLVPAFADTVYVYTGSAYNTFSTLGYQPTGVSGSFTVATSLAANLSLATISPGSFSFTDGFFTLANSTQFSSSQFQISTDGSGNITAWSITLFRASPGSPLFLHECNPGSDVNGSAYTIALFSSAGTSHDSSSCMHGDDSTGQVVFTTDTASVTTAGSWQRIESVPEPATIFLVGAGILGVAKRRNLRTA
jgi:hypothetical protein